VIISKFGKHFILGSCGISNFNVITLRLENNYIVANKNFLILYPWS
jgi:hypothetical protein